MVNLFVTFLLLYFLSILSTYFVGYVFLKVAKVYFENICVKIFISCTIGVSLIVSLYAVANNGYRTIFTGVFPLFLYLIFRERNENTSIKKESNQFLFKKELLIPVSGIALLSILVFCINFFISNKFGPPLWISNANGDYIFYSKISKFLSTQGQENVFHIYNKLLPDYFQGLMPYHYFDLWLNNLLLRFHVFSTFLGYMLLVVPYFMFLIVTGISAVLSNFLKSFWIILIVSLFAFFFFGGLILPGYNYLPKIGHIIDIHFTFQNVIKLYPVYLFLLLFVCASLLNKKNLAYFSLFLLIFVYSTALPAVVGSMILLIIFNLLCKKYKESILISSYLLLTILGLLCVFLLNPSPLVLKDNNQYSLAFLLSHFQITDLQTMLNILISSQYLIILLYLLPFGLLLFSAKKLWENMNFRFIVIVLGFVYLSSILSWILFFKELNSGQLFTNSGLPIMNILSLLILFTPIRKNFKFRLRILTFVFIVLINSVFSYHNFSEKKNLFDTNYYGEIAELISKNNINNKIGITLLGSDDYTSIFSYPNTSDLSDNLFVYDDEFQSIPLSDYEINLDNIDDLTKIRANSLTKLTFYRRYLEDKIKNENYKYRDLPKNAFEHQLQYIIDNDVKYAFISKNYPYWNRLTPYVALNIENKINQERFVIFNLPREIR